MRNMKLVEAQLEASQFMARYSNTLELPVNILSTFLGVAIYGVQNVRPGGDIMSLEEFAEKMGASPSALSAQMRYLSHHYRPLRKGMGLIYVAEHPENRRKRSFGLTNEGNAVLDHLEGIYLNALR